jgi:hypothetical protein
VRWLNEGHTFVAREIVDRFGLPAEATLAVLASFYSVRAVSEVPHVSGA